LIYYALDAQLLALLLTKAAAGLLGILVFLTLIVISSKTKFRKLFLLIVSISFLMGTFTITEKIKGQRYDQLFAAEGRE
jgi:hypothetical protein